jgi:hypothetical protein
MDPDDLPAKLAAVGTSGRERPCHHWRLLGEDLPDPVLAASPIRRGSAQDAAKLIIVPEGATEVAAGGIDGKAPPSDAASQAVPVFKQRRHDTQAKTLDITSDELRYMDTLAPLLEHSPRALKRFVNIYRLLKASLPPDAARPVLSDRPSANPCRPA